MLNAASRFLFAVSVIFLFIYILIFPYETAFHVKSALKLCLNSVIPSLFMYICLSKIITGIVLSSSKKRKPEVFLSKVISLPVCLVPACLTGLICGVPSSCFSVCSIYEKRMCSKKEAEAAIVLSSNCSAAFILSIASSILQNKLFAVIILFSNILSTLAVYMLFFRVKRESTEASADSSAKISFSRLLSDSISSSAVSCITLSGYVVFFYTLSSILSERISLFLMSISENHEIYAISKSIIASVFEMSSGTISCSLVEGNERIAAVSFAVAFCGISVFLQIKNIVDSQQLSVKHLILSKLLCALISPIITIITILIIPSEIAVFADSKSYTSNTLGTAELVTLSFTVCVFIIASYIISHLDKKHKNIR